jgi:hypothetical protein
MYSPDTVDRNLYALAKKGHTFKRYPIADSLAISAKLQRLIDDNPANLDNPKAAPAPIRAFSTDEMEFMRSEAALCRLDFRYFAERYGNIELDASAGGGIGPMRFWASQERALELISDREIAIQAAFAANGFSDGILTVWHKSRQLGATAIMRLINSHRMIFYRNTRALAASLDDTKVHELYVRDSVILDNLPFFLRPKVEFDVKDSHIGYEILKSRLSYQKANQQAGIGTGQQFDISHCTEVALWPYAERLKFDFLPAVPQSPNTFVAFESTANGRGNFWHEFTENIRQRAYGFAHWLYIFTPWYIESMKYRRPAPVDWNPHQVTIAHAEMVKRTSHEFTGRHVDLTKDQLFWWESEREMYRRDGDLHIFLTNYCATPEESFQHSTSSALPIETIEWMRSQSLMGMPYHSEILNSRA